MKKLTTLLLLIVLYCSGWAKPGGNDLHACVNNACPDYPISIADLASLKAGELIDSFYSRRHKFDGFNGCVMVARDGKPVYCGSFGYGNYGLKDTLTPQSSFQLASVTKTFTSTAILYLVEQELLSLDDTVQKFFPEFPYQGITVKHLLTHRTGLPDYIVLGREYFGKVDYLTNDLLMQTLIKKKPPVRCRPDRMFMYCNTNYAILSSIIENVSGVSYKKFMNDMFFKPLGMKNTFVFDMADSSAYMGTTSYESRWRLWANGIYDGVTGDKGIYSSVEDMIIWDNALRSGVLLSPEMQQEAYKPRSLDKYSFAKERDKNYGYGWRMHKQPDKTYMIYHNGFWHGSNNVFARDLDDGYTVIVLGNKANQNNYWTAPVWDVLNQLKSFDNLAEAQ